MASSVLLKLVAILGASLLLTTHFQVTATKEDLDDLQKSIFAGRTRQRKGLIRRLTCGKLYYRTFLLDERRDVLYVGAMDRVMRLNLSDITETNCQDSSVMLAPTNSSTCTSKGKTQHYDCRNHVRVIQPMGDGNRLYICGTNAHSPKDLVIYTNLTVVPPSESMPGIGNGIAKCPFDPDDNATALWVEHGNPGDLPGLYSGTVAEFTKADAVVFRTDLYSRTTRQREFMFKRTIKYDSKWLDKPDFVASFDIGDYIYFFFRETALEYINCGKTVYSRVARVCKKDTGGKNILYQNWATFVKARLNCSIPGEFPFYFNEIQSVYMVPGDDSLMYAVFTTSLTGVVGSAICTFSLTDILAAFEGKFKEQRTSSSAWLPVSSSAVPEPRPGRCVGDTLTLPDTVLTFIRSHPLLDEAVPHQNQRPVFYQTGVLLTHLVVDKVTSDVSGNQREYTVYYAASNVGRVHRLVEWRDEHGLSQTYLLDVLPVTEPEPVRRLAISAQWRSLYVSSDVALYQLALHTCAGAADSCLRCVADPYCGWDKATLTCRPYTTGLLQDVSGSRPGVCDSSVIHSAVTATWGQALYLACDVTLPQERSRRPLSWHLWSRQHGRRRVTAEPAKYVPTQRGGMLVLSVTDADAGRYEARLDADLLCLSTVTVQAPRCGAPEQSREYRKVYSEWCDQFEKYKNAMKTWDNKQLQCRNSKQRAGQTVYANGRHQTLPPLA